MLVTNIITIIITNEASTVSATFSRFTCPEKAIPFSSYFRTVPFLLTQAEKKALSQLKAFISA